MPPAGGRLVSLGLNELTQKLYTEKMRHVNITKPIIFWIAMDLTGVVVFILVKFYCFYKPMCTQTWGQISGSRVEYQI